MSDSEIQVWQAKGLSEDEAKLVQNWQDRGRPGVARLNEEVARNLYISGYSCQEIHHYLKDIPLEALLWSRARNNWDGFRAQRKAELIMSALPGALNIQAEGIKIISEILAATHINWREQIVKYIANPTKENIPDCLPKTLHSYQGLQESLKELIAPPDAGKNGKTASGAVPLVSVNISSPSGNTIEIKPGDAKQALKKSLGKDDS